MPASLPDTCTEHDHEPCELCADYDDDYDAVPWEAYSDDDYEQADRENKFRWFEEHGYA